MPDLSRATLAQVSPATAVPGYDRRDGSAGIVHIGVGGFHRAHQAVYVDALLARPRPARTASAGSACCPTTDGSSMS